MTVKRTYVYVDGFNVYYRALRGTPHQWLNIKALVSTPIGADNRMRSARYSTVAILLH